MLILLLFGCADNNVDTKIKDYKNLNDEKVVFRGGEEAFESDDAVELLGTSCVPAHINAGTGCNDVLFEETISITLPNYPGCTFDVVFTHYQCIAGGLFDYTLGDFQILSHDCVDFSDDLDAARLAGLAAFTAFVESFEADVHSTIQEDIISRYVLSGTYPCGQGLFFSILFQKSSCYKRCVVEIENEESGLSYNSYFKISCGESCCEQHTRVCRDEQGELYIEVGNYIVQSPACGTPSSYVDNPILTLCNEVTPCTFHVGVNN